MIRDNEAIAEINNRAIELVRETLRAQVNKLQPFQWDSPELKREKKRVAEQRIAVLGSMSSGDGANRWAMIGGVRLDGVGLVRQYSSVNPKNAPALLARGGL